MLLLALSGLGMAHAGDAERNRLYREQATQRYEDNTRRAQEYKRKLDAEYMQRMERRRAESQPAPVWSVEVQPIGDLPKNERRPRPIGTKYFLSMDAICENAMWRVLYTNNGVQLPVGLCEPNGLRCQWVKEVYPNGTSSHPGVRRCTTSARDMVGAPEAPAAPQQEPIRIQVHRPGQ
jgi:hypothetical protein